MAETKNQETTDATDGIDETSYSDFTKEFKKSIETELNSRDRFQPLSKREDRSDLPLEVLKAQHRGKYLTVHRGIQLLKAPEDLLIYQQMFWHIKPRTVIELGTYAGGSAIWMGDLFKTMELDCHYYSVDIDHSLLSEEARRMKPDNVTFLLGDCNAIEKTLTPKMLSELPRPLIVCEDSHVNIFNNLCYFHNYLQVGDYVVVEDSTPDLPTCMGMGLYAEYKVLGNLSVLAELKRFVAEHEDEYAVDTYFNDFYGYNFNTSWNSIIRRMK